ncbi:MAG: LuxR C-terminal-related transcriptional regulator [bacterium]
MAEPAGRVGARAVSERELEVLTAVGANLSNAQIASRLHLSVRTVESHVSSLLRKLGVEDRRALAVLAPATDSTGDRTTSPTDLGHLRGRPATWTRFVGREAEAATLTSALADSRLVTLLGPGGVGKTRLATVVAEQVTQMRALRGVFVDLVPAQPEFVVQTVAAVLGVSERAGQPLQQVVLDRLRHGSYLLVLDNCEHLIESAVGLVRTVLSSCPDVTVLTTSRERLGVPGERVVPLPGLSLATEDRPSGPDGEVAAEEGLNGAAAGSDAVALFFDRARSAEPQFFADVTLVAELCASLDGSPLAIELAAARAATLGVPALAEGLHDRLRLLSGGRGGEARHRSLRAMLDWSWELLDAAERSALRRLAVFAGRFDLTAATAVLGGDPGPAADLVGRLADKSLLVHLPGPPASRWRMLETVRAYALERLDEAGETTAVRRDHLHWAVAAARGIEDELHHGADWREDFERVANDLRAVLADVTDMDEVDRGPARRLARSVARLTYARRFLAESRQHFLAAAALAASDSESAVDLRSAADVALVEMRGDTSFSLRLAAAERAAAAGDSAAEATSLAEAASTGNRFLGMFETAVPVPRRREILARAEQVAGPQSTPAVQAHLAEAQAWLEARTTDFPDVELLERAVELARFADDPVLLCSALDALGTDALVHGQYRRNYQVASERAELLDVLSPTDPRSGLEMVDVLHMAVEDAVSAGLLTESLRAARRFDDPGIPSIPHMESSKPIAALVLLGRFDEALALGRESQARWIRAGRPAARWMALNVSLCALAEAVRDDLAAAEEWSRFARYELAGGTPGRLTPSVAGVAAFVDARVALHRGRLDEALTAVADIPSSVEGWSTYQHVGFDAYPWAVAAEVAVVGDQPDADVRIRAAEPAAAENPWARAYLHRARGRRFSDRGELQAALAGWEAIGARFERACTLLLLPERTDEGRAELTALGATVPAP